MMQLDSNNESLAMGKRTASGIQPGSKASDVLCRPFALWLAAGTRGHKRPEGGIGADVDMDGWVVVWYGQQATSASPCLAEAKEV